MISSQEIDLFLVNFAGESTIIQYSKPAFGVLEKLCMGGIFFKANRFFETIILEKRSFFDGVKSGCIRVRHDLDMC